MFSAASLLLSVTAVVVQANREFSYFYGEELQASYGPGPLEWAKTFPQSCGGSHQSPIDIVTFNTVSLQQVTGNNVAPAFVFSPGYTSIPADMTLTNDGHTIHLATSNTTGITFNGAGFSDSYKLAGVHFHWGGGPYRGSEHTINGRAFPLEMHLVHLKTSYPSVDAAKKSKDASALAVLGVLFEETEKDNPVLTPITDALVRVRDPNSLPYSLSAKERFAFRRLLPSADGTAKFYRYFGSLTTPPCNEVVAWTVFKQRLPISRAQLAKFRDVEGDHFPMADNFRPTQRLNGRFVRSFSSPPAVTIKNTVPVGSDDNEIEEEEDDRKKRARKSQDNWTNVL